MSIILSVRGTQVPERRNTRMHRKMFSIDVINNENYYIIKRDGKQFVLVNKAVNSVLDVMNFFGIKD